MRSRSLQSGITLIELLIYLSLVGMFFCLTTPFSSSFYKKNQNQVIADGIKNAVRYAKLQAIVRGERLLLTHRVGTEDWSSGMALYVETLSSKKQPIAGELLYEWLWPMSASRVVWNGFQSKHYLRFGPNLSQSIVNGTFVIDGNGLNPIRLVVNRMGRVSDGGHDAGQRTLPIS
ncbi:MAG: GspH/FimT family pseudopilin [Legionellaceae bacterium]|nr:GspH/FimT family pseudopilin [Legionellaceae bacterium]